MSASAKLTDWVEGCLESETKCPCTTCSLPSYFFSVVSWNMDVIAENLLPQCRLLVHETLKVGGLVLRFWGYGLGGLTTHLVGSRMWRREGLIAACRIAIPPFCPHQRQHAVSTEGCSQSCQTQAAPALAGDHHGTSRTTGSRQFCTLESTPFLKYSVTRLSLLAKPQRAALFIGFSGSAKRLFPFYQTSLLLPTPFLFNHSPRRNLQPIRIRRLHSRPHLINCRRPHHRCIITSIFCLRHI